MAMKKLLNNEKKMHRIIQTIGQSNKKVNVVNDLLKTKLDSLPRCSKRVVFGPRGGKSDCWNIHGSSKLLSKLESLQSCSKMVVFGPRVPFNI